MAEFGTTGPSVVDARATRGQRPGAFGPSPESAAAALALAGDVQGDFGSLAERDTLGAPGQGWRSIADDRPEEAGDVVLLSGHADPALLRATHASEIAACTLSHSASRGVLLHGRVTGAVADARVVCSDTGSFETVTQRDIELAETDTGHTATSDGFQILAPSDTDGDGWHDADDARIAEVLIWRDLTRNGLSEAREVQTRAQAGLVRIELEGTALRQRRGTSPTACFGSI